MMLLASPMTKFLTHVGHFGDHSRNQRRFAPTLPHFTVFGAPLQRNTQSEINSIVTVGAPLTTLAFPKIRTRGRDLHLPSKIPTGKE